MNLITFQINSVFLRLHDNLETMSVRMADLRIMSKAFGQLQKKNHNGYKSRCGISSYYEITDDLCWKEKSKSHIPTSPKQ